MAIKRTSQRRFIKNGAMLLHCVMLLLLLPSFASAQYGSDAEREIRTRAVTVDSAAMGDTLVDLNRAGESDLERLGLTVKERKAILDRLRIAGPYETFYDVFETAGL